MCFRTARSRKDPFFALNSSRYHRLTKPRRVSQTEKKFKRKERETEWYSCVVDTAKPGVVSVWCNPLGFTRSIPERGLRIAPETKKSKNCDDEPETEAMLDRRGEVRRLKNSETRKAIPGDRKSKRSYSGLEVGPGRCIAEVAVCSILGIRIGRFDLRKPFIPYDQMMVKDGDKHVGSDNDSEGTLETRVMIEEKSVDFKITSLDSLGIAKVLATGKAVNFDVECQAEDIVQKGSSHKTRDIADVKVQCAPLLYERRKTSC
ncbi:hypothetical protein K435DRAFT_832850 [Dendrothele bispora CBS 962.96]|uniref:Uncharacterized protein n=1 Tax=Dendrothele bispora (strain CBS 962.96) TaxID=1314807 RepID=A0A4V4HIX7_DENBC|nr:hypothetical protein K435DRAFT_832850 [Dendrothele bispora CBS 962.96]